MCHQTVMFWFILMTNAPRRSVGIVHGPGEAVRERCPRYNVVMPLKIAQLGQPVLRQRAVEVAPDEIPTPAFQQLVRDMRDIIVTEKGAGLAGPQVFQGKRLFLAAVLPPLE